MGRLHVEQSLGGNKEKPWPPTCVVVGGYNARWLCTLSLVMIPGSTKQVREKKVRTRRTSAGPKQRERGVVVVVVLAVWRGKTVE